MSSYEEKELEVPTLRVADTSDQLLYRPTEKELAACRPFRLCCVGTFIFLLVGLLVASIVLISITDKCKVIKDSVVYQIYVRSFEDSDGDGFGDFNGLKSKLPYIKKLGASRIVLNDVVGTKDFGLDITSGTKDDFEELLKSCKKQDIQVMIQMNPVVVDVSNPWFIESKNEIGKRSWFIWQQKDKLNNWVTINGSSAWHKADDKKSEFYYSYFGPNLPTLNYYEPAVVDVMKEKLKEWMDMGIDGFVMTSVSRLAVNHLLLSNTVNVTNDKDITEAHDFLRDLYQTVSKTDGMMYVLPQTTVNKNIEYLGTEKKREADVVLVDDFALLETLNVTVIQEIISSYTEILPTFGKLGWMFGGNSYKRIATRFGSGDQGQLFSMFTLIVPYITVPYYGDEVMLQDTNGTSYSKMKWGNQSSAGAATINSTISVISGYMNLSTIRTSIDAFGSKPKVVYAKDDCLILKYDPKILVGVNFQIDAQMIFNVTMATKGKYIFSTNSSEIGKTIKFENKTIKMESYQLVVIETE